MNVTRARTAIFNLAFTQSGVPLNILGMTVKFAVTDFIGNNPLILKDSAGNGIVVTDATNGLATLTISVSDTELLSDQPSLSLIFELILINGSQRLSCQNGSGPFVVSGGVIPDQ